MTDAAAATATDAAASAANQAALEDLVAGLGLPDDEPIAPRVPASAPSSTAAKKPEATDDDLADLEDDSKPFTAERAKEVRGRLVAARERAREETRRANAASARARAQEERFGRTKEKTLELKANVETERALLQGVRQALFSGNKDTVLQAIGHISGKDPLDAWREISLGVAGKQKSAAERDPELMQLVASLRQEISDLKNGITTSAQEMSKREENALVERLRDELVAEAAAPELAAEFPLMSRLASNEKVRPRVRALLAEIKEAEFSKTRIAIDNRRAFAILEKQLQAESELFQPVHAPSGQATDARGTTGPVPGDSASSRPEPAKQAPRPPPQSIPAELAARSGGTRRPMSEAERTAEIVRQTPASFFRDIGLGSLLEDGEE